MAKSPAAVDAAAKGEAVNRHMSPDKYDAADADIEGGPSKSETAAARAERARANADTAKPDWHVEFKGDVFGRWAIYAYSQGFSSPDRALKSLVTRLGNAAKDGKRVEIKII